MPVLARMFDRAAAARPNAVLPTPCIIVCQPLLGMISSNNGPARALGSLDRIDKPYAAADLRRPPERSSRDSDAWFSGASRFVLAERTCSPICPPPRHGRGASRLSDAQADETVGVILTIRSVRFQADGTRVQVVNLSGWFVDPQHAWLAPRMLQTIVKENDGLITDLTPTDRVVHLIGRLGFQPWHEGVLRVALPLSAAVAGRQEPVRPWDELKGCFDPRVQSLLDDHVSLGGVVAGLGAGDSVQPLLFLRTRYKGVPSGRLIYAENKTQVVKNIRSIARFLLRRGIFFLRIPANREDRVRGGHFSARTSATFCRGGVEAERIDHAYSEFVFFQF